MYCILCVCVVSVFRTLLPLSLHVLSCVRSNKEFKLNWIELLNKISRPYWIIHPGISKQQNTYFVYFPLKIGQLHYLLVWNGLVSFQTWSEPFILYILRLFRLHHYQMPVFGELCWALNANCLWYDALVPYRDYPNGSRPSGTYVELSLPSYSPIMACCLFGTQPLLE